MMDRNEEKDCNSNIIIVQNEHSVKNNKAYIVCLKKIMKIISFDTYLQFYQDRYKNLDYKVTL